MDFGRSEDSMAITTELRDEARADSAEPVLLVSNDSHVGPPVAEYRPYCPKELLEDFNDYEKTVNGSLVELGTDEYVRTHKLPPGDGAAKAMQDRVADTLVHYDVYEALRHMDEEGVAAEVVFHGAMNDQTFPFVDPIPLGLSGKPILPGKRGQELLAAGMRMYNRWLADYCSVERGRHIGLAQIPMWDVDLAVAEVEFAAAAGLGGINFPAPRPNVPDYNELVWEPLWSAAASLGLPLCTHGGSSSLVGDVATYTGVNGYLVKTHELINFSRRALPFMLLGGVFERHPKLKVVFTEQPSEWVESVLHDLDGVWAWPRLAHDEGQGLPKKPSDYFWTNCYVGVSFMSNIEARAALDQGTTANMLWGRDYPHLEGTWPYTVLSLRKALEGIPVVDSRKMLGLNAVDVYGLDLNALQTIAERVGPSLAEITTPVPPGEIPEMGGYTLGFREGTSWA
jgi:predicted TIM-barrel fold metal-dependent hydrolase